MDGLLFSCGCENVHLIIHFSPVDSKTEMQGIAEAFPVPVMAGARGSLAFMGIEGWASLHANWQWMCIKRQ
jgi:hypothetical protein